MPTIRSFAELVLGVLAPSVCSACAQPVARGVFCAACGRPPAPVPRSVGGIPIVAAFDYAPPLSTAIRRMKFENHPELARPLASLLFEKVQGLGLEPGDAFVPVPLHRVRLVERGFNQAALVAGVLARRTRSSFAPRLLRRRQNDEHQARLGRDARRENAAGAFVSCGGFDGSRVVLVDDVVTTGATASACLAALAESGIEVVAVAALAQASGRSC